ncbi:MAG: selenium cofactor biosynthesis protein YqeC, partial [Eubacteriales bacterium]|nr:selenium cofactor biosynthesis protein YqeC [Eubacteriales bacterium]
MRISELIGIPRGVTAVVGGGGKTSLILRLAQELSENHRVLVATTTHMWPPPCHTLLTPTRAEIEAAFRTERLLAVGMPTKDGKLAPVEALENDLEDCADYILVEADGSRGLPLKAPAGYEPVMPKNTALTIAVAGMECCGKTIGEAAHRPLLYAGVAGVRMDEPVTPEIVARVLTDRK